MTDIESIKLFLQRYLAHEGSLEKFVHVDWLREEAPNFSVETVPTDPVIKRYSNGAGIYQYVFVFASRNYHSLDDFQNIDNLGFYEDFLEWLEIKNRNNDLPEMETGKSAQKMEALTRGYLMSEDGTQTARYQIQCRLLYRKGV